MRFFALSRQARSLINVIQGDVDPASEAPTLRLVEFGKSIESIPPCSRPFQASRIMGMVIPSERGFRVDEFLAFIRGGFSS